MLLSCKCDSYFSTSIKEAVEKRNEEAIIEKNQIGEEQKRQIKRHTIILAVPIIISVAVLLECLCGIISSIKYS